MQFQKAICGIAAALAVAAVLMPPRHAEARVRLDSICTIYGQKEVKLTGLGLVVGLQGTGDGKNLTMMRALASALKVMNAPVSGPEELKDAKNAAIVLIEATVPKTGLRRGQNIDCYVSSIFGAKSLRGGRLLVTPVETADVRNDIAVGLASGAISIEDERTLTSGVIPGGISLLEDFASSFMDTARGNVITLLLDAPHTSFHSASEVARMINKEFEFVVGSQTQVAKAVGPGVIEVKLADEYRESPVEFIAEVLAVGIDNPHAQARVVVNTKTKTVVVTGEVEISPVTITNPKLTVQVEGGAAAGGANTGRFAPIEQQGSQPQQQLQQLVQALDQLRVPPDEIINVIRELHHSGKLHAAYEER
jgi:flagellar P-ring protein precursor FlgI